MSGASISRSVTLADVAAAAGVSIATASRALAGRDRVSRHTSERVHAVAGELGYRVDPIARALREGFTRIIGMIVPVIGNPFFAQLVDAVEEHTHRAGFELLLADSHGYVSEEAKRLAVFGQRRVDGVVVVPADRVATLPALHALPAAIPVVQVDRATGISAADFVGVDNDAGLRLVVEHLRECGARSVAYAGADDVTSAGTERWDAFRREADRSGLRIVGAHRAEFSIASGTSAAAEILARAPIPDAIVAASDLIAIGVIARLREAGIRAPDEVLVTGFDDSELAQNFDPSLTTVVQPLGAIARDAVDYLVGRIRGADSAVRTSRIAPTLRIGRSTTRE